MAASAKWQDWAIFTLGLWLAVSPWLLGFAHSEAATANAACVGLLIALGSHFELSFDCVSVEWLNAFAGACLVLAPFVLGFDTVPAAAANAVAVGAMVLALAASALSLEKELGKWWHRRAPGQ